jgi:hypothetical protein
MGEQRGSFHIKRQQKREGINPWELLFTTHPERFGAGLFN